jgi:Holliday junction resolvase RusA-like endonuclease
MSDPFTICLLGEPVAWARTRISRTGSLFTPQRQRNNAVALKLLAQQEMIGRTPLEGPVMLDVTAEFAIPKSFSRAKREDAITRYIFPTKKPDLSNIVKQVEDALNGVAFRDDAQIVRYGTLQKVYSVQPKIVVTVRSLKVAHTGTAQMRGTEMGR